MTATKQALHYSERLLIRQSLSFYARHLQALGHQLDDLNPLTDSVKLADELQQQFKDAREITLMFDD